MRGLILAAAVGLLAACAGTGGGAQPGLVASYCAATTPQLRAILRLPLLRALDLPADTGELVCLPDGTVQPAERVTPPEPTPARETQARLPAGSYPGPPRPLTAWSGG